ncbi:mitochondrial ribosomal protein L9 [Nomia melanderi]|uniref:mitochondrial ribosomal protein L9 n=1 Tax=Nomia melanderi TaxID=2448451 RepID=UPI0013046F78|nr:39S ribosomal protein L9, mitochondrial [Nomia melanderi]
MSYYTKICVNHLRNLSNALLSNHTNVLMQQTRNTYILKRRYPVPLHKKDQKPHKLKAKHFIYDVIENKAIQKQPDIDLILLKTISGIGVKGQKISIRADKGYNNLLLPKLAVYATPENIEKYAVNTIETVESNYLSSEYVTMTVDALSHLYLNIVMNMHIPWTIEKWHIRTSFRKTGIVVPEDAITMPKKEISGPDLSIENKEFYVTVKINNQEEVKVRCKIHHWTSDRKNKLPYTTDIWNLPNIAVFPKDQEVIDSLPKHRLCMKQNNDN